jgi:protein-tyrosine phosphatase
LIDLHCHLLPALDDGPADLGNALRLAQAQVAAGVRTVAATPHAVRRYPNDAATVARGVLEMRTALRAAEIPLELLSGAEIDLAFALELPDEELSGLALGGGRWLLLEAPLTATAPLEPGVASLRARGFEILLAHPERAPMLQRDPAAVARMVRGGVRTQVTAGGLRGQFGKPVQKFALRMIEEELVHTLASDAHDASRRPPGLSDPLEAAGLGDCVRLLCDEHPAALLAGEPLPERVPLRRRRGGLLSRLRR